MATNYQRGYAFENKIVRFFRDLGFFVIRSAGSKGPVDVIAWNETDIYLIQAKANSISPSELRIAEEALRGVPFPVCGADDQWGCEFCVHREVWVKGNPKLGDWHLRHEVNDYASEEVSE